MKAVLDLPAQRPSIFRVRVLQWIANLCYLQSDFPASRPYLEEALTLSRRLGSDARSETAKILDLLGELATEVGEHEKAPPFFEEALAIFQELGDLNGMAEIILQLGWAAMRVGNYPQASTWLNQCRLLFCQLNKTRMYGFSLAGLGEIAIRQGQYEQAIDLLEQSLVLRRELRDPWSIATSLGSLGWVAMLQHDFDRMRKLLKESLALRIEIGESGGTAWCLEKLAQGIWLEAQNLPTSFKIRGYRRCTRLLGAAEKLRMPINSTIDPADLPEYETILAELRLRLGKNEFETTWAESSFLTLAEIIDQSMQFLITAQEMASLSASQSAKARYGGLSLREREAAIYIARGKVNHEIARLMYVRVRTAETYVTRILNKLGFELRAQIVAWAHETGLIDEEISSH